MKKKSDLKNNFFYRLYVGTGIFTVALMTFLVLLTVVLRYVFSISFPFMEEFITVTFAFTTFWGAGICVIENENINIDMFYAKLKGGIKKGVYIFNTFIVLVVNVLMFIYSIKWVVLVGSHRSMGMKVPTAYIYGIMPVCTVITIVCIIIVLINAIKKPAGEYDQESELPPVDLKI